MTTAREEFKRGWAIIVAGAVGTAFGISALPFYTLGVFVKPVGEEFGWSRETVQWGFATQMLGMVLVGWLYGWMSDRIGARRVALFSQVGLAIGFAALSFTSGLAGWYGAWFLLALLGAGTSPITWTRGISVWFDRARGAALGLALLGTGITGLVAPPLVTAIIAEAGWRAAYLAIAGGILLIAVPVVWLLFRDREAPPAQEAAMLKAGATAREAFANYRFYILLIVFAAITFGVGGVIPTLVPLLTDRGLSPAEAAGYASMAGLAVILGRVLAGFLLDRFWAPAVAFIFLALPALSCIVLAQPELPSPLMLGLSAALVGLAAGAEFDLIAFIVSRYFGMRNYGLIYSIQMVALLFAGGLAPPVFGRIYDVAGSYSPILYVSAGLFIAAPLLMFTLGRYPDLKRGDVLQEAAAAPSAAPAV